MEKEGAISAPDNWQLTWHVECFDCSLAGRCTHDCGHPGSIKVFSQGRLQYHISGEIEERKLIHQIAEYDQERSILRR